MLPIGKFTSHITVFLLAFSNLIYLIPSSPLVIFKVMFFLQIFQLVLIWQLSKSTVQTVFKYSFIIAYILSRGILAFRAPILEDDYYRYLWDGQVFLSGINPYQYAPLDEKLDLIVSAWRSLINYPDIRTIYPPVAQFYFAGIFATFGESVFGLRIGAVVLELLVAFSLSLLCKRLNRNQTPVLMFLFFPTVMKENFNSIHFDLLSTLFLLTSIYFLTFLNLKAHAKAAVAFSMAVASKLYPLIFLPLLLQHSFIKKRFLVIIGFSLLAVYSVFLSSYETLFSGAGAFANTWVFFDSAFGIIQKVLGYGYLHEVIPDQISYENLESGLIARLICGVAFGFYALVLVIKGRKTFNNDQTSQLISVESLCRNIVALTMMLFVFSAVLNTWYWLWILPLMLLIAPKWTWSLPVLTVLGYSWFVDPKLYEILHWPAYGLILAFAAFKIQSLEKTKGEKNPAF